MRPPKKSESLEIRLPHQTKQDFMQACRTDGVSASDVLRGAISRFLDPSARAPRTREKDMFISLLFRRATIGGVVVVGATLFGMTGPAWAEVDPRLAAVFGWVDRDHDGRVDRAEFEASMEAPPPLGGVAIEVETIVPPPPGESRDALFRRLDANRDGALSLSELAAGTRVRTELSAAVAAADGDGDGRLTEAELAAYLTSRRAAAGVADPAAGVAQMVHGIIGAADPDHRGSAQLAELLGH